MNVPTLGTTSFDDGFSINGLGLAVDASGCEIIECVRGSLMGIGGGILFEDTHCIRIRIRYPVGVTRKLIPNYIFIRD